MVDANEILLLVERKLYLLVYLQTHDADALAGALDVALIGAVVGVAAVCEGAFVAT